MSTILLCFIHMDFVFHCVFRGDHRPHSALPMARRLFQCPYRRSGGVSWHRLFTLPRGTNRQTDRQTDTFQGHLLSSYHLSFSALKVKILNSKVYVSVKKKVSMQLNFCLCYFVLLVSSHHCECSLFSKRKWGHMVDEFSEGVLCLYSAILTGFSSLKRLIPRPSCKQFHVGTIVFLPNYTVSLHRWKSASTHDWEAMMGILTVSDLLRCVSAWLA